MSLMSAFQSGSVSNHPVTVHDPIPGLTEGDIVSPMALHVNDAGHITAKFATWNATITYPNNSFAVGSNSLIYVSVVADNLNNNPTTDTTGTNWITLIDWVKQQIGWKTPCRVAATSALPAYTRSGNVLTASANGSLNSTGIDGVTDLAVNQRVLNANTGADAGIYYITSLGSAGAPWTMRRALDADASADFVGSMVCTVQEGSSHPDSYWMMTTNTSGTFTLNTTSQTWAKLATAGAALPVGTDTQTIRNSSGTWVATSILTNDGNSVTITPSGTNKGLIINGAGCSPTLDITNTITEAMYATNTGALSSVGGANFVACVNDAPDAGEIGSRVGGFCFGKNISGTVTQFGSITMATEEDTTTNLGSQMRFAVGILGSASRVIRFSLRANGDVVTNASGSEAGVATTGGFLVMPTVNGVPSGTPANSYTGAKHSILDRAHNTLFINPSGSAWVPVNHRVPVTLTDAATIATDASLGKEFRVTLGGNRTMGAPTNPVDGQIILYTIKQDGTGSRTLAWNAVFQFSTDVPSPTLTTTASATDEIMFIYNSTAVKWRCLAVNKGFA